ncbi:MAG: formyltransferase family protein, partial [Natronomonas sp.]
MKIAGMASNRGRNLLHIADTEPGGAEFSVVLTNEEGAPVIEGAAERGIPTEVVPKSDDETREEHERRVLQRLEGYDVDIVCLDGYMRILTDEFLNAAPTTLNVHPSLLPSFPGMDAYEQV